MLPKHTIDYSRDMLLTTKMEMQVNNQPQLPQEQVPMSVPIEIVGRNNHYYQQYIDEEGDPAYILNENYIEVAQQKCEVIQLNQKRLQRELASQKLQKLQHQKVGVDSLLQDSSNILPTYLSQFQEEDKLKTLSLIASIQTDRVRSVTISYISFNIKCPICNILRESKARREENNSNLTIKYECCRNIELMMRRETIKQQGTLWQLGELNLKNCDEVRISRIYLSVQCQCEATAKSSCLPLFEASSFTTSLRKNTVKFASKDGFRHLCARCCQECSLQPDYYIIK